MADAMPAESPAIDGSGGGLKWLPVTSIVANPYQPRRHFDETALEQLAASIRQDGVMQPIVVRPRKNEQGTSAEYEIVAGERRWRAAQRAELATLPAVVRELDDRQMAEWALIENLQREDLNPIERAQAFARLIEQFSLRHEDVADRVGVSRVNISNTLRLLDLHSDVQELVRLASLSAGHARALLSLPDGLAQVDLAKRAIDGQWSVRTLEMAVRQRVAPDAGRVKSKTDTRSPHVRDVEQQVGEQLGSKVKITPGRKKGTGTLIIEYYDLDHFDQLLTRMGVNLS
ncbi:MAG: ParB/RepB/Spo0J family partition protein [Planctomycetes bacterium]|nr:ParB/RepB/Spo0J family partition protein [Planctomycetota bacterium]